MPYAHLEEVAFSNIHICHHFDAEMTEDWNRFSCAGMGVHAKIHQCDTEYADGFP